MCSMFSSPTERAKEEYWLNQDRIAMGIDERVNRHLADCQLALVEAVEKLTVAIETLQARDEVESMIDLYRIPGK